MAKKPKKKKAAAKKAKAKPPEVKEKPQPTKAKKPSKKFMDGFAAFAAKSEKTWPGTTAVAADLENLHVPRISSGNIGIDIATFGGWPRGRFSRIYGKEKSSKTGSCLSTVAHWQHNHCGVCYETGPCAPDCPFHGAEEERPKAGALWIDAEHRLESMWYWVEGHGVDRSRMLYQCPPDGQHVVDFADSAIREHGAGIGLIVVDSLAHITSNEEIKKPTVKGKNMAVNAQLIGRAIRKWTSSIAALGVASTRKPTVLLINQERSSMGEYGPKTVQPGGSSPKYCAALDLRLASGDKHYLVYDDVAKVYEDKTQSFGTRWKPGPDMTPDYVEINYRVTSSGVCPPGRYGKFNYWLRHAHGRRIGDPDNVHTLWEYVRRLDLIEGHYGLFGVKHRRMTDLKVAFFDSPDLQRQAWEAVVAKLMAVE